MALDPMAIVSYGVYPTPTPTSTLRAALAVSFGLLNITLPAPPAAETDTAKGIFTFKGFFNVMKKVFTKRGRNL